MMTKYLKVYVKRTIIKIVILVIIIVGVNLVFPLKYLNLLFVIILFHKALATINVYNNFKLYLANLDNNNICIIKLKSNLKLKHINSIYLTGIKLFPVNLESNKLVMTDAFNSTFAIDLKTYLSEDCLGKLVVIRSEKSNVNFYDEQLLLHYDNGLVVEQVDKVKTVKYKLYAKLKAVVIDFVDVGDEYDI